MTILTQNIVFHKTNLYNFNLEILAFSLCTPTNMHTQCHTCIKTVHVMWNLSLYTSCQQLNTAVQHETFQNLNFVDDFWGEFNHHLLNGHFNVLLSP